MSALQNQYGLAFNTLVLVRISAQNTIVQGPWSLINSAGATISVVP